MKFELSEAAKAKYSKYVGPDGKLIIDDSLSDNLKEAFQFFNDKGINIMEMNIDDAIPYIDEGSEISSDNTYDDEDDFDIDELEEDNIIENDTEVSDLDDVF